MERPGHSSIRVTLDTYGNATGGLQEAAAQRFDDFISARGSPKQNVGGVDRGDRQRAKFRIGVSGFEPPTT